jgi:hypothetical protein
MKEPPNHFPSAHEIDSKSLLPIGVGKPHWFAALRSIVTDEQVGIHVRGLLSHPAIEIGESRFLAVFEVFIPAS